MPTCSIPGGVVGAKKVFNTKEVVNAKEVIGKKQGRRNRGLEEKEVERGDMVYNLLLFTHNSQLYTTLINVPSFSCAIYGQNLELFFLPVSFQAVKILIFLSMLYKGDPQRWNDCPLRLKYYY